jgi:signal transduction histidine kinase
MLDDGSWASWHVPLAQFASGARVTVSLYDRTGERRAGPFLGTATGEVLATSAMWRDGCGYDLERQVAQMSVASNAQTSSRFEQTLTVLGQPILLDDLVYGAAVFGWVFDHFPSSLGCGRLARLLDLDPNLLWRTAKSESPMPPQRIAIAADLLATLTRAHAAHLAAAARTRDIARTRDRFLARAAHELRTPLSAIRMRVELLLRTALGDEDLLRSGLTKIDEAAATEARLVEDLVDAGRTLTGELRVTKVPINVRDLVRDVVEGVGPLAQKKRIEVSLDESEGAGATRVLGDDFRLRQVLGNLLTNAIKFTPEAGRIAVRLHVENTVQIEVTDTGIGIEPAVADRIFEPFVRTDRNNESGLGLGLAITRQIVELHGGSITASSAGVGLGSTFTVSLPRS